MLIPVKEKSKLEILNCKRMFFAMGFDESDYEILMNNNFDIAKTENYFRKVN